MLSITEYKIITKTCPCNKQRLFLVVIIEKFHQKNFNIFLIFAQNIDCGYTLYKNRLAEAVLTSTHILCFGAKIRKIGIPLQTLVYYIKVGFKGVYIARTCFPDDDNKHIPAKKHIMVGHWLRTVTINVTSKVPECIIRKVINRETDTLEKSIT